MKGENDKALKILERLHSQRDDNCHDFARGEFLQISQQLEIQAESDNLWKLLKDKTNRKRFFLGIFVQ